MIYRVSLVHALLSAAAGALLLAGAWIFGNVPGWLILVWAALLIGTIALRCPTCGRNVYRRGSWVTPVPVQRCSKCDEDLT